VNNDSFETVAGVFLYLVDTVGVKVAAKTYSRITVTSLTVSHL